MNNSYQLIPPAEWLCFTIFTFINLPVNTNFELTITLEY